MATTTMHTMDTRTQIAETGATVRSGAIFCAMGNRATRDEILDQIRRMPLEDREYIEAELLRDGYKAGRRIEDPAQTAELVRRTDEALTRPDAGVSREEGVARARAAVEVVRARKS